MCVCLCNSRHVSILCILVILVLVLRSGWLTQVVPQKVQSSHAELGVADHIHEDEYHDQGQDDESNDQAEGIGIPKESSRC